MPIHSTPVFIQSRVAPLCRERPCASSRLALNENKHTLKNAFPSITGILVLIFFCLCLFNANVALAEEEPELITAGELLQRCEEGSAPGAPNQFCMRYVFGLVQTVLSLQQAEQSPPVFCINPQIIRLEEATDNVIAYLRGQSSRTGEEAQILVIEALHKNYPCSTTSQT